MRHSAAGSPGIGGFGGVVLTARVSQGESIPQSLERDGFSLRNHLIGVMERAEVENDAEEKRELLTFVVVNVGGQQVNVGQSV